MNSQPPDGRTSEYSSYRASNPSEWPLTLTGGSVSTVTRMSPVNILTLPAETRLLIYEHYISGMCAVLSKSDPRGVSEDQEDEDQEGEDQEGKN